jgi:hypothetical protein
MGSSVRSHFRVSERHSLVVCRYTEKPDDIEVLPMPLQSPLNLRVPRNLTATLQLIQRLVGREQHQHYCDGVIPVERVSHFLHKMTDRYPQILRTTRERSYDRRRHGHAAMHMIVFPPPASMPLSSVSTIHWLLLSDRGKGGLADERSADFRVSRDAMSSHGHIEAEDYVLLYASKRRPSRLEDRAGSRSRFIFTECSTWTWKIRGEVTREIRAAIDERCRALDLGAELLPPYAGGGLRALLAAQRRRPLFSGVRNQVIDLHRYAAEAWLPYRNAWLARHPRLALDLGPIAGALTSARAIMQCDLPTMSQLRLYGTPPRTVCDLLADAVRT